MSEPLKLRLLEHLVLLADELNFVRAAEQAFLSQSAFSRSIQALEESVGLRLFDRGPRFVKLTPAGQRLVIRARRLLSSSADLQRELEVLRSGGLGDVVVGAGPFTAVEIFPGALARLRREQPRVNVKLKVDNWLSLLEQLTAEKLDFFISDIRGISPSDEITVQRLGTLQASLFCRAGHPLLATAPLDLCDLVNVQLTSVYMPDAVKDALRALLPRQEADAIHLVFECENAVVNRELVFRTDVVLLACRSAVQVELECGRLRELPVRQLQHLGPKTPLRTEIGIVRCKDRTIAPASEILLSYILEIAASCLD